MVFLDCVHHDLSQTAAYDVGMHLELSKRCDKRLELAARKCAYEATNATKKRILEEGATWSWWKVRGSFLTKICTHK